MPRKPEDRAREDIDRMLEKTGWGVQDIDHANIDACQGIAIRDFSSKLIIIVDRKLSDIEHLWLEIDSILKRAERLWQSILKKAFSGRLI